jgi:hypothetical protein
MRVILNLTQRIQNFLGPNDSRVGERRSAELSYLRGDASHNETEEGIWSQLSKFATYSTADNQALPRQRRQAVNGSGGVDQLSDNALVYHYLASQLAGEMARKLGWDEKGLIWFAFAEITDTNPNDTALTANILLAERRTFGLLDSNDTRANQPPNNLTTVVEDAATAFQEGRLNGIRIQGTLLQLEHFSSCEDLNCQQVALNVTAPPNATGGVGVAEWSALCTSILLVLTSLCSYDMLF